MSYAYYNALSSDFLVSFPSPYTRKSCTFQKALWHVYHRVTRILI